MKTLIFIFVFVCIWKPVEMQELKQRIKLEKDALAKKASIKPTTLWICGNSIIYRIANCMTKNRKWI